MAETDVTVLRRPDPHASIRSVGAGNPAAANSRACSPATSEGTHGADRATVLFGQPCVAPSVHNRCDECRCAAASLSRSSPSQRAARAEGPSGRRGWRSRHIEGCRGLVPHAHSQSEPGRPCGPRHSAPYAVLDGREAGGPLALPGVPTSCSGSECVKRESSRLDGIWPPQRTAASGGAIA